MSIIHSIDSETLAASGVVAGAILIQATTQLEAIPAELAWRRPRAERRFAMIQEKRAPRYAIYGK